jgi:hypothetical protein
MGKSEGKRPLGRRRHRWEDNIITWLSVTKNGFLDWWLDLFDSLIQRVTTRYSSLLHTHTHTNVHSHVFTCRCSVAASNLGCSPSSGFPKFSRPQLPASHGNNSQRLNLSSSLTDWLIQSLANNLSSLTPLDCLHFANCPAYNISARTAQKTPSLCCCVQLLPCKHACFRSRYLVTAVVYLCFLTVNTTNKQQMNITDMFIIS